MTVADQRLPWHDLPQTRGGVCWRNGCAPTTASPPTSSHTVLCRKVATRLPGHGGDQSLLGATRPMSAGPSRSIGVMRERSRSIIRGPSSPPIRGPTASIRCASIPSTTRRSGHASPGHGTAPDHPSAAGPDRLD